MSIFQAYDAEFSSLNQEIIKNMGELKSASSNSERANSLIKQIEGLLSQSNDLIKQMEVEVRSHDPATRKVLSEKVANYKKSQATLKSDFERAREQAQRSELIGSKSAEQRQRLLDANEKINRQNELIAQATRTVAETEEVGVEITQELERNRAKIESSRAKAREFSSITDSARRILGSMSRRDVRQRWMICFIAVVLIIAIAITAYYSTAGKKK